MVSVNRLRNGQAAAEPVNGHTGVEGLVKTFRGTAALRDMDLDLEPGKITVILGPSGCGKTTLLRILAGLDEPDRGRVTLGGRVVNDPRCRVAAEDRGVGMVFQDSLLWPHLRVRGNISFPLGSDRKAEERVRAAAEAAEGNFRPFRVWRSPTFGRL